MALIRFPNYQDYVSVALADRIVTRRRSDGSTEQQVKRHSQRSDSNNFHRVDAFTRQVIKDVEYSDTHKWVIADMVQRNPLQSESDFEVVIFISAQQKYYAVADCEYALWPTDFYYNHVNDPESYLGHVCHYLYVHKPTGTITLNLSDLHLMAPKPGAVALTNYTYNGQHIKTS